MLAELARRQIQSEIRQIEDLLAEFAPLIQRSQAGRPDVVDRAALGAVLHSFYTGIEGIFLTVAKRVDEQVPVGDRWHRDLLDRMAAGTERCPALITTDTKAALQEDLAFRHFFRQAYSYALRWEEMQDLVGRLPSFWSHLKTELEGISGS